MSGSAFVWPLSASPTPDEMNTSFGPRIDAERWDFHDGIDLPARVGTPIHAMADGIVYRAGPADKVDESHGFGSTHVVLQVVDPSDGQNNLYLVYIHLDSIPGAVIPGAPVARGDVLGAVGQQDATYPHLHFEFRKGGPEARRSVHPLRYLPYTDTSNITNLRLDRCNFYDGSKRAIRLRFSLSDRREGDLQSVDVTLKGSAVAPFSYHVDFDDRDTITSGKGDEQAFTNGIAVEGYQKSNLKGEGLWRLRYGAIVKDVPPQYESVELDVTDATSAHTSHAEFSLPVLGAGDAPVHRVAGFEGQTFPPNGWQQQVMPGNTCQAATAAALTGTRGLLCRDAQTAAGALVRAALLSSVPTGRMSWRLRGDIKPVQLQMSAGSAFYPLAFLAGDGLVSAACLRKVGSDYFAGVLIRTASGMFRELIGIDEGRIAIGQAVKWELDLLRLATRQTTAVVRVNHKVIARLNGDTTSIEPDAAYAGILHRHGGLQITLHLDQLALTEEPR